MQRSSPGASPCSSLPQVNTMANRDVESFWRAAKQDVAVRLLFLRISLAPLPWPCSRLWGPQRIHERGPKGCRTETGAPAASHAAPGRRAGAAAGAGGRAGERLGGAGEQGGGAGLQPQEVAAGPLSNPPGPFSPCGVGAAHCMRRPQHALVEGAWGQRSRACKGMGPAGRWACAENRRPSRWAACRTPSRRALPRLRSAATSPTSAAATRKWAGARWCSRRRPCRTWVGRGRGGWRGGAGRALGAWGRGLYGHCLGQRRGGWQGEAGGAGQRRQRKQQRQLGRAPTCAAGVPARQPRALLPPLPAVQGLQGAGHPQQERGAGHQPEAGPV